MQCGISTACFYPARTLDALRTVADTGAPVTEIFLNTFRELEDGFARELEAVVRQSGIRVSSIHPFSSMLEGFLFASRYEDRTKDGFDLYEKYFSICQRLGADKLVFHGDHKSPMNTFPLDEYAQRFCRLAELGLQYSVRLCHENVFYCRLADPFAVAGLRPLLGEHAAFVLDMKQALRGGVDAAAMLDAMGGDVCHVHISDHGRGHDCLPPGQGEEDFPAFISQLAELGFQGDLIIELYRDNFSSPKDLTASMEYIHSLIPAQGNMQPAKNGVHEKKGC